MIGSDSFHEAFANQVAAQTPGAPILHVPGLRMPAYEFCAGRLALDFCNTLTPFRPFDDKDRLTDATALIAWAHRAGWTLPGVTSDRLTAGDFQAFLSLRQRLWNLFTATIDGSVADAADIDALDGAVLDAFSALRLSAGAAGQSLHWQETAGPIDKLRHAIARDAADLLTSGNLGRLKRCPGEMCGWLFYDGSKNGTRRWCAMEDCGTRAKVKRFRNKQRGEPAF